MNRAKLALLLIGVSACTGRYNVGFDNGAPNDAGAHGNEQDAAMHVAAHDGGQATNITNDGAVALQAVDMASSTSPGALSIVTGTSCAQFPQNAASAHPEAITNPLPTFVNAITPMFGWGGGPGNHDGVGTTARFNAPVAIATDSAGVVYVADFGNSTIRKIATDATVTTLAGSPGEIGSVDGQGAAARFSSLRDLAMHPNGTLYVYDNDRIRTVSPAGVVTTTALGLAGPLAIGSDGAIYVANGNNTIVKVDGGGQTLLAGDPASHTGWVDGVGSAAHFQEIENMAINSTQELFVTETPDTASTGPLHRVTQTGRVDTIDFGIPVAGIAIGPSDELFVVSQNANQTYRLTFNGNVATSCQFQDFFHWQVGFGGAAGENGPADIASDGRGGIFTADFDQHFVQHIDSSGTPTIFAGDSQQTNIEVQPFVDGLESPIESVAVGPNGNIHFTTNGLQLISAATGLLTTSADTVGSSLATVAWGATTIPGEVTQTSLDSWITEEHGPAVANRSFASFGNVVEMADGTRYAAQSADNAIVKVTTSGVYSVFAGAIAFSPAQNPLPNSGSADGAGSAAQFNFPRGMAADAAGNLLVADAGNNTIRKITPAGVVSTFLGTAGVVGSVDAQGAAASFNFPSSIAIDAVGTIFISDKFNHTIRSATADGHVTTLAGAAGQAGSDDGVGSAARFDKPEAIALDGNGNIFVADFGNSTVRKIASNGAVTTVIGRAGVHGVAVGDLSTATLNHPTGLAYAAGRLYVTSENYLLVAYKTSW